MSTDEKVPTFIDADAHVDECADTWTYFPKSSEALRPVPMVFENDEFPPFTAGRPATERATFIDGHIWTRQLRRDDFTSTTAESRELRDVSVRVKHMDELGVDVQVLFPTLLLHEVTPRPEVEFPLCIAYNRWISDRCADTAGRLRWTAILPLRSMPEALNEMRRAKEDGAIGIFKRAYDTDDRHLSDPYFFPMLELAEELELPICVHTSRPYIGHSDGLTYTQSVLHNTFYVQDAFLSVVRHKVYKKFPGVRFGFIEAAAGWVPHISWLSGFEPVISDVPVEYREATGPGLSEFLSDAHVFVTTEMSEDIPKLIEEVGNDCLMLGSDYTHSDRSSVLHVHQRISEMKGLSDDSVKKLTSANGRQFFGLA